MARADTYTLTPLDTFAYIAGIHPGHFNTLAGGDIFPITGQCSDVWWQFNWQAHDRVSRDDLAQALRDAEKEVASILGYSIAPEFVSKEMHRYPRPYRKNAYGYGYTNRDLFKSVKLKSGYFIQGGRRGTTLIGTATTAGGTLVYSDPDGDGFNELATITLPTTVTDACEHKVYFAGKAAKQAWEIRPAKSKTISGGNIVIELDSWLLVDQDLQNFFPTDPDNNTALDPADSNNFVISVDVYREFVDFSQPSAQFYWERTQNSALGIAGFCGNCGGSGCPACSQIEQNGCLQVRDTEKGVAVPVPGTYDSDSGQWLQASWLECREPDQVKMWYQAGWVDEGFLSGASCDPVDLELARIVSWITIARMERNFCNCGNTLDMQEYLRDDLARSDQARSYNLTADVLENPLGTKRGEVMAWQKLEKLGDIVAYGGLA